MATMLNVPAENMYTFHERVYYEPIALASREVLRF